MSESKEKSDGKPQNQLQTGKIEAKIPRLPKDKDGYTVSFRSNETNEIKEFFEKWGVVVVRDVIDQKRIEGTIDEIWEHPRFNPKKKIKRNDPKTWDSLNWPPMADLAEKGFISYYADWDLPYSWENRQEPSVYSTFSTLWGRPDIWVRMDRYGVMRPTILKTSKTQQKDGKTETIETIEKKDEWKTNGHWLHWDQNPFTEPNFVRMQGLVTLTDHIAERGGFNCVAGMHHRFIEWAESKKNDDKQKKKGGLIYLQTDDPLYDEVEKVLMRAGSLLVWDSRICHSNFPNQSDKFRMVQYITFEVAGSEKEREKRLEAFIDEGKLEKMNNMMEEEEKHSAFTIDFKNKKLVKKNKNGENEEEVLPYKFPSVLTELGQKILGSKAWEQSNVIEQTVTNNK